jgi:zinc/manganese transport system substrate-binding protein
MNDNSSHYQNTSEKRSPGRLLVPLLTALSLFVAATGCGGDESETGLHVVATTTVLGDVTANVIGDAGSVEVLLPLGADPHDYQASSRQVADVMEADLVVANGLHLEEGLGDVLDAAAAEGVIVLEVGDHLDPLPFGEASGHDGGSLDPHLWLDPLRMADATHLIADALTAIDPNGGWDARAAAYAAELVGADQEIAAILATVPAERRVLVTGHDALGYFADRYGFTVLGTIIPGGSTLADPSSAELADLVAAIRNAGVPAIFVEAGASSTVASALADELAGEVAVVELYIGSLGEPGSDADTLIGMLTTNARRIAEALG